MWLCGELVFGGDYYKFSSDSGSISLLAIYHYHIMHKHGHDFLAFWLPLSNRGVMVRSVYVLFVNAGSYLLSMIL